jgi:xylulokinase
VKFWASVDEACDAVVKVQQRVRPDPGGAKVLAIQYENFRRLYPALKPLFAQLNSGA